MDIISYGVAGKAAKSEKATRNNVLGAGVEGTSPHVKDRIDTLESALQGVVSQADKLIVNDAVNIMKAHAKLNSVAKTMKYKMQNMVFDDLLDLSGIDTTKSSGYTHDVTNGLLTAGSNCVIETKAEITDTVPSKVILTVEESLPISDVTPKMTSNTSPIPYVVSSDSIFSSTYLAFNAFDKDSTSYWMSNKISTGWIKIDFGSTEKITKYSMQVPNVNQLRFPTSWTLEGSNTGLFSGEQIILDTKTNQPGWGISEIRTYSINTPGLYRYYRINISAIQGTGTGSYNPAISDLTFYQEVASSFQGTYSISRDSGATWEPITPETLFYFIDSISPKDKNLVLKVELPAGAQLLNYSLTWI
jgi:hypothetical protein